MGNIVRLSGQGDWCVSGLAEELMTPFSQDIKDDGVSYRDKTKKRGMEYGAIMSGDCPEAKYNNTRHGKE